MLNKRRNTKNIFKGSFWKAPKAGIQDQEGGNDELRSSVFVDSEPRTYRGGRKRLSESSATQTSATVAQSIE